MSRASGRTRWIARRTSISHVLYFVCARQCASRSCSLFTPRTTLTRGKPKRGQVPTRQAYCTPHCVLHQLCTLRRTCAYASVVPAVLGPFTRHLAHSQGRARSQLVVSCPAHPPPRWLRAHTTQRYYMLCGPWSWERPLRRECLNARATLCTVTAPPNLSTGVQGLRSRMVVNAPAD